jgi:hypothetical protein
MGMQALCKYACLAGRSSLDEAGWEGAPGNGRAVAT